MERPEDSLSCTVGTVLDFEAEFLTGLSHLSSSLDDMASESQSPPVSASPAPRLQNQPLGLALFNGV